MFICPFELIGLTIYFCPSIRSFAIQFAKATGATVIATTSSSAKEKVLRRLGVDHVINYRESPDWDQEVQQIVCFFFVHVYITKSHFWRVQTSGRGVDHIVEVLVLVCTYSGGSYITCTPRLGAQGQLGNR